MASNNMSEYDWEVAETGIDNIARMVSAYHISLLQQSIEKEFAEVLTIEYQACLLEIMQQKVLSQ